jgi:hypothetical protein
VEAVLDAAVTTVSSLGQTFAMSNTSAAIGGGVAGKIVDTQLGGVGQGDGSDKEPLIEVYD